MMNDLNIYGRISDLFYKDMLGLADEEEKRELDSLLVTYKLKGLDREKIIARLQEQEVFDGKEAYREFRALKTVGRKKSSLDLVDIDCCLSCRVGCCRLVVRAGAGAQGRKCTDHG